MVSRQEFKARIDDFYTFSRQEMVGIIAAVLVTGFIFSFRDWGAEMFDAATGLKNLLTLLIIAAISFIFRLSCQKWYSLSAGYKAEFKVWWTGLAIALVIAFVSFGRVPLVLAGTMATAFMVKQRLGEFRYGFSYWNNAMIAMWGILGNMIIAILFAVGLYFLPDSYFFQKGLILNLMMGFTSLWPVPQLEGLHIFFGSRGLYWLALAMVALAAVLLLSQAALGLIIVIIIATIISTVYLLVTSEK